MGLTDIAISESLGLSLPRFETEGVESEAKLVPSSSVLHSTVTDFIILPTDIDMDMADTSE